MWARICWLGSQDELSSASPAGRSFCATDMIHAAKTTQTHLSKTLRSQTPELQSADCLGSYEIPNELDWLNKRSGSDRVSGFKRKQEVLTVPWTFLCLCHVCPLRGRQVNQCLLPSIASFITHKRSEALASAENHAHKDVVKTGGTGWKFE